MGLASASSAGNMIFAEYGVWVTGEPRVNLSSPLVIWFTVAAIVNSADFKLFAIDTLYGT